MTTFIQRWLAAPLATQDNEKAQFSELLVVLKRMITIDQDYSPTNTQRRDTIDSIKQKAITIRDNYTASTSYTETLTQLSNFLSTQRDATEHDHTSWALSLFQRPSRLVTRIDSILTDMLQVRDTDTTSVSTITSTMSR